MSRLDRLRLWLARRLYGRLAPPAHRCEVCGRGVPCSYRCAQGPHLCPRHDPQHQEWLASMRRNYELQARLMGDIHGVNAPRKPGCG